MFCHFFIQYDLRKISEKIVYNLQTYKVFNEFIGSRMMYDYYYCFF